MKFDARLCGPLELSDPRELAFTETSNLPPASQWRVGSRASLPGRFDLVYGYSRGCEISIARAVFLKQLNTNRHSACRTSAIFTNAFAAYDEEAARGKNNEISSHDIDVRTRHLLAAVGQFVCRRRKAPTEDGDRGSARPHRVSKSSAQ